MKIKIIRTDGVVIEAEGEAAELERLIPPLPVSITSPPLFPWQPVIPFIPTPWPYQPQVPTITWTVDGNTQAPMATSGYLQTVNGSN